MSRRQPSWSQLAIGLHLAVFALASWQLAGRHSRPVIAVWAALSGVSLFVLTGLVHEASHRLLARWAWLNEAAGNLAGWVLLTPLSAYRAFHLKHHQTTNRADDPNTLLNSRWMLLFGSMMYVIRIHFDALRKLRRWALARYLLETAGMALFLAALVVLMPKRFLERSWLLPLAIVAILQNIRMVTEHLDLPAGRYRDTWQLALPGWLSRWLLHYDHHLEHHLRPGLHWHELPLYRAALKESEGGAAIRRVTLATYFREVFLRSPETRARASAAKPAPPDGTQRAFSGDVTFDANRTAEGSTPRPRLRADSSATSTRTVGPPAGRYHGLDALRAATMLLVVALHAALAYAPNPLPNLIWAVHDRNAHPAFDLACWWILGISSPFFLMSGFFAAEVAQARGRRALVVSRLKRILAPFLVAGTIILPATFFVWVAGWLISDQCTLREFQRMKFHGAGIQRNLYGPAHLWSLEYLVVMLVAYWIWLELRRAFVRTGLEFAGWSNRLDRLLASPWRPFLLAVPTTWILWAGHSHGGLDAILDRQNSFVPETFRLLHNAVFFAVGVSLHRSRHLLGPHTAHAWTYLILSCPIFAARAWLIDLDLRSPLVGLEAIMLAASGALFTWLITFGFLGLALGALDHPRPAIRYLADSSYWIYLVHLPIVGLLQADFYLVAAPATLKFLIVLGFTMSLGLASYQVMVRHTVVGEWLHGRRDRTPATVLPAQPILRGITRRRFAPSPTYSTSSNG
jgi:fatty acid desaturase/peptidoglycan/LPS O-acetylase OafA/YrhL